MVSSFALLVESSQFKCCLQAATFVCLILLCLFAKKKPRPYKRTRLLRFVIPPFFADCSHSLPLEVSDNTPALVTCATTLQPTKKIVSVQSSKMYSPNASLVPLINRQLSVSFTNRYLFLSQPLFMLQLDIL